VLRLVSLPLVIITFGLILLVINAAMLALTAQLSDHLAIDNFWSALLGALLISTFSAIAEFVLPIRRVGRRR
jgi:putative membrane protein